jgi:tryptophanyl-tRNA synthetase
VKRNALAFPLTIHDFRLSFHDFRLTTFTIYYFMKKVLSCIQPTGDIHLGNYFGAVKNWVDLQTQYVCNYGVVDYHSMTMPYKAEQLRENTWKMTFQLLACGVKPENLFIQSLVPEHAELCWLLGCVTSFGQLTRMTQFKDKTDQLEEKESGAMVTGGLFYYPVLQAADILIYRADYVPIGKDQEQHLELARNIAERFNFQFEKEYFACPQPLFTEVPKLLSLADPNKKMSKSLGEKHYINLFGDEDRIRKQVRSAVTDSGADNNGTMSAGVKNLFELLKACNRMEAHTSLMADYQAGTLQYGTLKSEVAEAVMSVVTPIKNRMTEIQADKKQVKAQIQASSAEIRKTAQATLREVKEIMGIMNPKV